MGTIWHTTTTTQLNAMLNETVERKMKFGGIVKYPQKLIHNEWYYIHQRAHNSELPQLPVSTIFKNVGELPLRKSDFVQLVIFEHTDSEQIKTENEMNTFIKKWLGEPWPYVGGENAEI